MTCCVTPPRTKAARDMTCFYVWHDSFFHVRHDLFSSVTCFVAWLPLARRLLVAWLIFSCDMTQFYAWHDSFLRVTRLVFKRDMTCCVTRPRTKAGRDCAPSSKVHYDSLTWLISTCAITYWQDSFLRVPWLIGRFVVCLWHELCHTSHTWYDVLSHTHYEGVMAHTHGEGVMSHHIMKESWHTHDNVWAW